MYSNLTSKLVSVEETPIFEICKHFSIPQEAILKKFSELYYFEGIGVCLTQKLISHNLVCIEQRKKELVPTQFFYDWLENQLFTSDKITLQSTKWCNEWLYSKDIPVEFGVTKDSKKYISANKWYLIYFYKRVVGVGEVEENLKFLKNWHNISSYLFEE
jgi:hypothetical protein